MVDEKDEEYEQLDEYVDKSQAGYDEDAAYEDFVERQYEMVESNLNDFLVEMEKVRFAWKREKLLRYMVAFAERKLLEVKVDD